MTMVQTRTSWTNSELFLILWRLFFSVWPASLQFSLFILVFRADDVYRGREWIFLRKAVESIP